MAPATTFGGEHLVGDSSSLDATVRGVRKVRQLHAVTLTGLTSRERGDGNALGSFEYMISAADLRRRRARARGGQLKAALHLATELAEGDSGQRAYLHRRELSTLHDLVESAKIVGLRAA